MLIAGFKKNSFVDYPGKLSAVVFTPFCNMRCWYCHNWHILGADAPQIAEDEVLSFLEKRKGYLDAVVISGGEPTLQQNLSAFIDNVREMGYLIKLDSNGTNPRVLAELIKSGRLDYIAMDVKAPFEKYSEITGIENDIAAIRRSATLIINSGVEYEFRTTFAPTLSCEDIGDIARELSGAKRYFIQQYRKVSDNDPDPHRHDELHRALELAREFLPQTELRGE